jgi:predicted metal-dependent phosphoesterase TrpH
MLVDFHIHSYASKDSATLPAQLVHIARRKGLGRIVITDHNSITGALAARELDPELVIVGEEIFTSRGEILAVFVTQEIPPGLTPQQTILRLRDQGAFISVSHPYDGWRNGAWQESDLLEILPLVDAIEIFNARCLHTNANQLAQHCASVHNLPGTAGSDAHAAFELGSACLELPAFDNADGLRLVIGDARVVGKLSPWWVHFVSRLSTLRKKVV